MGHEVRLICVALLCSALQCMVCRLSSASTAPHRSTPPVDRLGRHGEELKAMHGGDDKRARCVVSHSEKK